MTEEEKKEKKREQYKRYYEKNRDKIKEKKKSEYSTEKRRKRQEKYLSNPDNRSKLNEYSRLYRLQEKYKIKRNETRRNRMDNDIAYKLNRMIGNLIRYSVKRLDLVKSNRTQEILGCSFEDFKIHLESKFEPWMNWDNYGKIEIGKFNVGWDIDHIIPISTAKNEEEVIKLNHFSNLRPLCSYKNRYVKKDSLDFTYNSLSEKHSY
jgi:hypothetical protein